MTSPDASTTLRCGRDLLDLAAQVSDGTPPADPAHQARCPYCSDAIERLRTAASQLRVLAGEHVQVPRGLTRRVIAQLRRERGRVPLARGLGGADTVSDLVITQIARRAAMSVDGVRQCSIELEPATADGDLSLAIRLTAMYGPALPELAGEVRRLVAAELLALTGLRAGDLTIVIDDVDLAE